MPTTILCVEGGPVAADGPRLMGIIKEAAAMPRREWLFSALKGVVRDEFGGILQGTRRCAQEPPLACWR